ncbi:hypothetical protein IQ246_22665 [aff. Roholtiella sp. LEGE 12411]|nr:hypothetical protein [aff. Roholtiella sp. LEGE 12411]MBE9037857.1 hypothetical protein [aff. Roholtiella sp. LEGE 12411]
MNCPYTKRYNFVPHLNGNRYISKPQTFQNQRKNKGFSHCESGVFTIAFRGIKRSLA